MKMKLNCLLLPIAVSASVLAAHSAPAQEGAKPDPGDEAAQMEAYMKLIAPGPEHKQLKSLVGDWSTRQTLWMVPGAPAQENAGTAKFRMAMGGRYLVQNYSSEIAGMGKFQGRGTTAYDKVAKEYVDTWIDSFSTGIMVSRGKAKDDKTIEMIGEALDPFTKNKVKYRTVANYSDDGTHEFVMFESKEGEDERKVMAIVYTRVKGSDKKPKKGAQQEAKRN